MNKIQARNLNRKIKLGAITCTPLFHFDAVFYRVIFGTLDISESDALSLYPVISDTSGWKSKTLLIHINASVTLINIDIPVGNFSLEHLCKI